MSRCVPVAQTSDGAPAQGRPPQQREEPRVCPTCLEWFEERAAEIFAAAVEFVERREGDLEAFTASMLGGRGKR